MTVLDDSQLFEGLDKEERVWMSHGDRVVSIPDGFKVIGTSQHAPYAAISDTKKRFYGVQFHPEVVHTLNGSKILKNFTHKISGF